MNNQNKPFFRFKDFFNTKDTVASSKVESKTVKRKLLRGPNLIILGCLLVITFFFLNQLPGQDREVYINKYKDIAMSEMDRAGIPASIKLAQGILESGAGSSSLAKKAKNHFGMKCGSAWTGPTYFLEDDDYDDNGDLIKSCFRVFKNADASYIAHSEFLRDPNKNYRYGPLFRLDPRDYKAWAHGLKRAGYATSPTYAEKLIRIIETYKLFEYDSDVPGPVDVPNTNNEEEIAGIFKINQVKVVLAKGDDTPVDIADRTSIPVKSILKFNENLSSKTQSLLEKSKVYIQRKRGNYRGKKKYHYVKAGDSMFDIAQQYGLRLDKLYKKNRLNNGSEPAVGERIKIRGWKVKSDEIPRTSKEGPVEKEEEKTREGEIEFEPSDDTDFGEDETESGNSDFDNESLDDLIKDRIEGEKEKEKDKPNTPPVSETEDNGNSSSNGDTAIRPVYHKIVKGDTLYGLARKYGTTVATIKHLNGLSSNVISVGQSLRIR